MNGINNNISNSNYGSFGNNNSNTSKEEKSIFDEIVDSVKDFFDDDSSSSSSSYPMNSSANLERAFLASQANLQNSYTLAPQKDQVTLGEKWAKENENAEIKQKEREISNLKQKVDTLQSRNKILSKQNDQIAEQMRAQTSQSTNVQKTTNIQENTNETQNVSNDAPQTYTSVPTHTSIPKEVLEQQQKEIEELSAAAKPAESKEAKTDAVEIVDSPAEVKA